MSFECMNCPDRHMGCHADCESYLEEKEKLEERNKKRRKYTHDELMMRDYYRDQKNKRKSRR